jgi:hypothetical protein
MSKAKDNNPASPNKEAGQAKKPLAAPAVIKKSPIKREDF